MGKHEQYTFVHEIFRLFLVDILPAGSFLLHVVHK